VGQSRHFDSAPQTSALPRSADIADQVREVRKVPRAVVRASSQVRKRPQVPKRGLARRVGLKRLIFICVLKAKRAKE
jgi:hypothetical protein